jgi:hypothetical protein
MRVLEAKHGDVENATITVKSIIAVTQQTLHKANFG